MKKVQIVFAGAALLLASAGVFANKLVVTTYYQSTAAGAHCTTPLVGSLPVCADGIRQCQKPGFENGQSVTFNISRIIDENPCEIVPRP